MRDSFAAIAADRRAALSGQIRTSSGFTWRGVPGVFVAARLKPGAPALGPRVVALREALSRPDALMRALLAWPEGEALGRPGELAERAGFGVDAGIAAQRVGMALLGLERAGRLRRMEGGMAARGDRAVLIVASGRVLMTADAPAHWADALRRMEDRA